MKKLLLIFVFGFGAILANAQNLKATIKTNPGKYGYGETAFNLSFTVTADSRDELIAIDFTGRVKADSKINGCQVIIDDTRPIAVLIIEANVESDNEFLTLIKNLYSNIGLVDLNLNDRHFNQPDTIQL